MLREILSITGKPGLFKIISHNGRILLVEDLKTNKRFPVGARDKVVSLGDIAMYTDSGDKPLGEILDLVYAHNEGAQIDVKGLINEGRIREEFEAVVPDFDQERVYDNDIKKLFTWYNLLTSVGYTKFTEEVESEEDKAEEKESMETRILEAEAEAGEEGIAYEQ